MPLASAMSAVIARTDSGVSCRLVARRSAVTMIASPMPSASSSSLSGGSCAQAEIGQASAAMPANTVAR